MLNPPLNQLTAKVNSKYLIATTAAKRARELDERRETALLDQRFYSTNQLNLLEKL